ncbi:MAG: hypothetical protein KJ626_15355, partial [Verrucomicrobia bacterium]|nr:hypothetical protein [Verrucomicrobiota bacterium]
GLPIFDLKGGDDTRELIEGGGDLPIDEPVRSQAQVLSGGEACWECPDPVGPGTCACDGGGDDTWPLGNSEVELRVRSLLHRTVDLKLGDLTIERRYDGRLWRWGNLLGNDPDLLAYYTRHDGIKWQVEAYHGGNLVPDGMIGTNGLFMVEMNQDDQPVLIGIKSANGTELVTYEYSTGRISAIEDRAGRRVEYGYTGGLLTSASNDLGEVTRYEYDTQSLNKSNQRMLVRIVDPDGRKRRFALDKNSYATQVTGDDGVGPMFLYEYDGQSKEYYAQVQTPGGLVRETWYRKDGTTKRVDVGGKTVKSIVQDREDQTVTDAYGNRSHFDYDSEHKLVGAIFATGAELEFTYENVFKHLTEVLDANGLKWRYQYSEDGRLTNAVKALGSAYEETYQFDYDTNGWMSVARRVDASNGVAMSFTYNASGLLTNVTGPLGTNEYLSHDVRGNVLLRKDANGGVWHYSYDKADRVTLIVDPLGGETEYTYDSANRVTGVTDPIGSRTDYTYDNWGNLVQISDPLSNTVVFVYNDDQLPVSSRDELGHTLWTAAYDDYGRLETVADPAGRETVYQYDTIDPTDAHPVRILYPTHTVDLTYDMMRQLTSVTEHMTTNSALTTTYQYDYLGRPSKTIDPNGYTTRFAYDAMNRLVSITNALGGVISADYDAHNRLQAITDTYGALWSKTFTPSDRTEKEIDTIGNEITHTYNSAGHRTSTVDAEGRKSIWSYNELGLVTQVQHFAAGDYGTPVETVVYGYDANAREISCDNGTLSHTKCYDHAGRVVQEIEDYGNFALTNTWVYAANGLPTGYQGPNGIVYSYSYNAAN